MPEKTLRYWEDVGVLPEPDRTPSGYRDYGDEVLDRIAFVRAAQAVGLKLGEIRGVTSLRDQGEVPCGHTLELMEARRADLDGRIVELERMRGELDRLIRRGRKLDPRDCDEAAICHLIAREASAPQS